MEVEEELEALEATFSSEVRWNKLEPSTNEPRPRCTYRVHVSRENKEIVTLELQGKPIIVFYHVCVSSYIACV